MLLTVEQYDSAERAGKRQLSNRFLEAFQPVHFEKVGYPTRIENGMEVMRFLDSMHDGRLKRYCEKEHYAPTYEEFEMIKDLTDSIYQMSKSKYGKGVIVKAPMLSSMNVLRRLRILTYNRVEGGCLPTIFEIGGGSGILGAMSHKAGYPYISTDITQSFYLTQNNLWATLFPDCVQEHIDSVPSFNTVHPGQMVHIPYWKLWELRNSELEADIMVANHCLSEMHDRSLRFYLQYGKRLMRNSRYKLFAAQNSGAIGYGSGDVEYLLRTFDEMGYALLYSQEDFVVFCLKDKQDISPVKTVYARKYGFPVCENVKDKTAALFYAADREMKSTATVSLEELEKYFYSLDTDIDSPDEEFIHYCNYERA